MATSAATKKAVKVARSPKLQPENYGYAIALHRDDSCGFRIVSGCRNFTPVVAMEHWKRRSRIPLCYAGDRGCECQRDERDRGRNMVKLLPILEVRARSYGWLTATKVKRVKAKA